MTAPVSPTPAPPEVGRWPKVIALLLAGCAGLYVLCAIAVDLPASPVQSRLAPVANHVVHPIFDQDWQLFAPNPATSNNLVEVEAKVSDHGSQIVEKPFDIELGLEDMARHDHVLPTKMAGLTLAANEEWDAYRAKANAIRATLPPSRQPAAKAELDRTYHTTFDTLGRAGSCFAHHRFPHATITDVRVIFIRRDMVPFSERNTKRVMPDKATLRTSWMPYVDGVECQ